MFYRTVLLLAFFSLFATFAQANDSMRAEFIDVLKPGQRLYIDVSNENELSGGHLIDPDGTIRMPLIGVIHAAGYTVEILENFIARALRNGYINDPHVQITTPTPTSYYVMGAIKRPGEYIYQPKMSVLSAIAAAGGYNRSAKKSYVRILRNTPSAYKKTGEKYLTVPNETTITAGDVIIVDKSWF